MRTQISVETLPYRTEVLEYIRRRREGGGIIHLVTAADTLQATQIAQFTELFDEVYASDDGVNLKGGTKAECLVSRFGTRGFDYIGDAEADLEVWRCACTAIVSGGSKKFLERVREINSDVVHLEHQKHDRNRWLRLIRIHQWAKNLIIFLPMIASHQMFNMHYLSLSVAAFSSMCLVASSTYIINDLFDISHDREHALKKLRPLADGSIGIFSGIMTAGILALAGAMIAWELPMYFQFLLIGYVCCTLLYSYWIKRIAVADTVLLAGLYTLRLIAGHAVTGIHFSIWLLAFAIFIFFSLALAKRFVELTETIARDDQERVKGRGYRSSDIPVVGILGGTTGMMSVLIVILYINSQEVLLLYRNPIILILLVPLLLYWIGRLWIIAYRSELYCDPVFFALKDRQSYCVAAAMVLVMVCATIVR